MGEMTTTPEKRQATVARYRQKYPERTRARWAREEQQRDPVKRTWKSYRANAKYKGFPYNLPRALHDDLVTDRCFYCGSDPNPVNGIDRVDNSRGYEDDNVVSCCEMCNRAKRDVPAAEFISWARRFAAHQARK